MCGSSLRVLQRGVSTDEARGACEWQGYPAGAPAAQPPSWTAWPRRAPPCKRAGATWQQHARARAAEHAGRGPSPPLSWLSPASAAAISWLMQSASAPSPSATLLQVDDGTKSAHEPGRQGVEWEGARRVGGVRGPRCGVRHGARGALPQAQDSVAGGAHHHTCCRRLGVQQAKYAAVAGRASRQTPSSVAARHDRTPERRHSAARPPCRADRDAVGPGPRPPAASGRPGGAASSWISPLGSRSSPCATSASGAISTTLTFWVG